MLTEEAEKKAQEQAEQQSIDNAIATQLVPVTVQISADKFECALVSSFEGGSREWLAEIEVVRDPSRECRFHSDMPFFGAELQLVVHDGYNPLTDGAKFHRNLTLQALVEGFQILAQKYPHHAMDLLADNGDAVTGDVLVQCAIFGDIVYA
jgi:hypothetical protein